MLPNQLASSQCFSPNTKAYTQFNAMTMAPPRRMPFPVTIIFEFPIHPCKRRSGPISSVKPSLIFSAFIFLSLFPELLILPGPVPVSLALRIIIYFLALLIHSSCFSHWSTLRQQEPCINTHLHFILLLR